jgi:hypothetical protein
MNYKVVQAINKEYDFDSSYQGVNMNDFDLWLDTLNLMQQTSVYEALEKVKGSYS